METIPAASAVVVSNTPPIPPEKRNRSIFDVPADFFDSCKLLRSPHSYTSPTSGSNRDGPSAVNTVDLEQNSRDFKESSVAHRWTCNICKAEFESLLDQRSHFKSDIHRFNVPFFFADSVTLVFEFQFFFCPSLTSWLSRVSSRLNYRVKRPFLFKVFFSLSLMGPIVCI